MSTWWERNKGLRPPARPHTPHMHHPEHGRHGPVAGTPDSWYAKRVVAVVAVLARLH
ncbi:hypothetical protein ACWCXX_12170 [Streptomyces sp. NPDC001732]